MSHITQRQLHWLCGKMTSTGKASILCAARTAASPGFAMDIFAMDIRELMAHSRRPGSHAAIAPKCDRRALERRGSAPEVNRPAHTAETTEDDAAPKVQGNWEAKPPQCP